MQLSFDGFVEETLPETVLEGKAPWYTGRTLSHSSISLYRTCPQRWKFRYIDKIPEKPRSFFSFGKCVHASLEFLYEKVAQNAGGAAALPTLDEVLAHYKNGWLRDGYESPAQEKWFFQEGERILKGFYAKHQKDFQNVLQVELKFTALVEGIPITGFIDRIDNTPRGGIGIVDYKTGKAFDKSRVRADPQLTLYQIVCRELLGRPVETVTLYHLNSLTPLTVPAHSPAMEDQVKATVVEAARGISEKKFDPRVDERGHCQWCDYAQICPGMAGRKISPPSGESLPVLVDRLGKLDAKLHELQAERDRLKESFLQQIRRSGETEAQGRYFKAKAIGETGAGDVETGPLPIDLPS